MQGMSGNMCFVPPSVYIGFLSFVLPEAHAGGQPIVGGIVWGVEEFFFIIGEQSHRRRPVLPVPARPRRSAVRRTVPTRPGNVRVLESTGPLQARTKKFRCKLADEQNLRLTTGLLPVYHRDEKRSSFLDAH